MAAWQRPEGSSRIVPLVRRRWAAVRCGETVVPLPVMARTGTRVQGEVPNGSRISTDRALTRDFMGAGDGNRTRVASLEDWGSATELHPRGLHLRLCLDVLTVAPRRSAVSRYRIPMPTRPQPVVADERDEGTRRAPADRPSRAMNVEREVRTPTVRSTSGLPSCRYCACVVTVHTVRASAVATGCKVRGSPLPTSAPESVVAR